MTCGRGGATGQRWRPSAARRSAKRRRQALTGGARRIPSGRPGILAFSVLHAAAAAAAAIAESAAGEQQDQDDDEQNCEHGSPPESQLRWLARVYLCVLFLLRPVTVSATLSTAFFAEPLAWSMRPSFFRCLSPVSAPAASFTRPFALSMFLLVMNPPDRGCGRAPEWALAVGAAE